MEKLATRAGVSRRTVFNHFGSVEEAAFSELFERFDRLATTIVLPPEHLPDQLPQLGTEIFTRFLLQPEALSTLQEMAQLSRLLDSSSQTEAWTQVAIAHAVELFSELLAPAAPQAAHWQVRLVCSVLITAIDHAVGGDIPTLESQDHLRERILQALDLLSGFPRPHDTDIPHTAPSTAKER